MPALPGQGDFRPTIQQIPTHRADAEVIADAVQKDLRPGETRYARTGPGVPMPEKYTVENADLIFHARVINQATGEVDCTFLTKLNGAASVELLTGMIAQISAVAAHHSAEQN